MLREVRFEYQHDNCWLQETSENQETLTLVVSSVYMTGEEIHVDLTVHAPQRDTIQRAYEGWAKDPRIHKISKLYEGPRGSRYHVTYTSEHSIYPYIIHHTPLSMGTISMSGGVEHYHIVGSSEDIQDLLKKLAQEGSVRVQSMRTLEELPQETTTNLGTASLTDKQVDALLLAHTEGYYRWPRDLSAAELARRLGLSSSAFLEHLRHAEAKVLDAVVAELRQRDPGRVQAVRARMYPTSTKGKTPGKDAPAAKKRQDTKAT